MPASTGQGGLWQKLARWLDVLFLLALVLATIVFDFSRFPFSTLKLLRFLLLLYLGTIFVLTRLPLLFLTSLKELSHASHGRQRVWRIRRSVFLKIPLFALTALFIFYTFQPHSLRRLRGQEATPSASLESEATPSASLAPEATPSATLADLLLEASPSAEVKALVAQKKPTLLKRHFRAQEELTAYVGSHQLGSLQISLTNSSDKEIPTQPRVEGEILKIGPKGNLRPGKYHVKVTSEEGTILEQDFTWGVLAINTNKSIYLPGENVYLQMASLDEFGHTICNAKLRLQITNPKSETTSLSTENGTIKFSDTCGSDNVTDNPDYFAYYQASESGTYHLKLSNQDNGYEIDDSFEVKEKVPFEVERIGATRINPYKANYWMTLKIKANEDFEGEARETLPTSFAITQSEGGQIEAQDDVSQIVWPVQLKKGDYRELKYEYHAPDVSPQFYLLGPLELYGSPSTGSGSPRFSEARRWQVAADAACTSVAAGGTWSTDATWTGCGAGHYPGEAGVTTDTVIIAITSADTTVTLDVDGLTVASITFNTQSTKDSGITHSGTNALTVTGAVTFNGQGNGTGDNIVWKINAGSATVGGLISMAQDETGGQETSEIDITTGTLNANGGITFSGTDTLAKRLDITGAGRVNLKGALTVTGCTLTSGTDAIFNYADSAAAQTVTFCAGTGSNYYNLYLNNTHADGVTLGAAITSTKVTNNVVVQTGTFKNGGLAIDLAASKTFQVDNGAMFEMSGISTFPTGTSITYAFGATSTVRYLQTTSPLTITDADYGHLELKPAAGATYNFPAATVWVQGNLTVGDGTNAAAVSANNASTTLDVGGDFTIAAGSTFTAHASNPFTVGGSWSNSATGTFTHSSGTVTFDAGTTGKQIDSGGDNFNNVIFNNAAGGWTAATNTFTVAGTLTVTGGDFDIGAVTIAVNGATSLTSGGLSFSSTDGTKTFTGNVTLNGLSWWDEEVAEDFSFGGNFTNNTVEWIAESGIHTFTGGSKTFSGFGPTTIPNVSISGSLTNASENLAISNSLAGAGTFTNGNGTSGTLNFGGASIGVATFTASAANNTVNYDSSSASQTVRSGTYHSLAITKSGQEAAPDGALVVNSDLTIAAGTLAMGANALTVGSTAVTDSGKIKVAGIISQSSSGTTTIKSSAASTASCIGANSADCTGTPGTIGFYNLTIGDSSTTFTTTLRGTGVAVTVGNTLTMTTNATLAANGTLNVAGNWTRESSSGFDPNSSTVVLNGGASTIQTISGANTFYALEATTTSARTIKFPSSVTTTISNSLTLTGTTGPTYLTLAPSTTDTVWTIDPPPSSVSVSYVSVSYSTATECINATNSFNGDYNTNWAYSGEGCNQNPSFDDPPALAQKKTTDVVLAVGDWTNEVGLEVKFTANAEDLDASDTLYLCVEKKAVADTFTGPEDACSSPGVAYSGSPVEVTVTIGSHSGDTEYHWRARIKDAAGAYSSWLAYGDNPAGDGSGDGSPANRDYGIDTSDPTDGDVYDGTEVGVDTDFSTTSLSQLSANWANFVTTVSGLNKYQYSIGTTQGGIDTKTWTDNSTTTSVTASGLTLQTSQVYYFNVRAVDNAGNTQSPVISSDGQVITPSLSFSVSPSTLPFANLNEVNSYTDTEDATLTTSTNAYNGYVIRAFITDYPRSTDTLYTIIDFNGGSYASPDGWLSADRGFGYTSSDTSVQGSNKFGSTPCAGGNSPPCYAPFNHTGPGDIVADHTATVTGDPITGEVFTITCKVMADSTKEAANYVTTIVYTITAQY